MTDHHDFGDHHYDDHHEQPLPFDEPAHDASYQPDDHYQWADDHDHPIFDDHHDQPPPAADHHDDEHPADPDPDPTPDTTHDTVLDTPDDPAALFPPHVDVGDLPEPVDGFPWIDTSSLGLADPGTVHAITTATTEPVHPHELAEYAATDLPPAVDPWAALADSDDPATSALARWFHQN